METQSKDLQDYIFAIKKRKAGVLAIFFTVLIISVLVAYLLPPKFKSTATILIEQQEIPQELVMSTVTSYAAERIKVIEARVMSRANLMDIVDKYDLYPDERKVDTTEEIIARITDDIKLDIISAEVVDPRTGRPSTATIAFSLSYVSESPSSAQRVANELTSLYLNENLKNRTQKAEDTSTFFAQETDRLLGLISDLEQELAEFKQENADLLPELQDMNMQILQRKETELSALERRLVTLEDKKFYLAGQLAQIDPGNPNILSPQTRLKALEVEYSSVSSRYAADHPDVIRLKSEIDTLRQQTGQSADPGFMADQLKLARTKLTALKEKYTPDHPDVLRAQEEVSRIEAALTELNNRPEDQVYEATPDNPAYITLQAQLASTEGEIKSVKQQQLDITKDIEKLESDLLNAPLIEKEYRSLARAYDDASREYAETRAKQARADSAKTLETEKKGERFTLVDPAALPEQPFSPNRPAIMLMGFIFSITSGLGFAVVANAISGTVHGARSLGQLVGVAPLAIIPYQLNDGDTQRRKRYKKRTILAGIMAIITGLLLIHFLISPLDVLWYRILRKLDI